MAANLSLVSPAWQRLGGQYTAQEIAQQPVVWEQLAAALDQVRPQLDAFLGDWLRESAHRVIFTGAGSSGFIAEMVADQINAAWAADMRAVVDHITDETMIGVPLPA